MKTMWSRWAAVLVVCVSVVGTATAQTATPDGEAVKAAERLLRVQSPAALLDDMTTKLAPTLPPDQRDGFVTRMRDPALLEALIKYMREAMIRNLTADEMNAMADFYSTPAGRSAMAKFGSDMADLQPRLMQEIGRRFQPHQIN